MSTASIVVYAIAGAVGALLAALLVRGEQRKQLRVIVTVVAVIVLGKLGDYYVAKPYEADRALREIPAFEALREHEPATYQKIRADMLAATRGGANRGALRARVRAHTEAVVAKYIPRASDEALRKYMAVLVEEIRLVAAKNPADGVKYLFPAPGEAVDVAKYLDPAMQKRDLDALAELIRTGAAGKARPVDPERANVLLEEAMTNLRSEYGDEAVDTLAAPRAAGTDPKLLCAMTVDLYESLLRLPPADSAIVLRDLLAGA